MILQLLNKRRHFEIKNLLGLSIISIILIISLNLSFNYLSQNFEYLQGTIKWQEELFNGELSSGSLKSLNKSTKSELDRLLQESTLPQFFFGNGKTNWDGMGSIKSDSGYLVQFFGFGLVGSIIIWLLYFFIFIRIYNTNLKKYSILIYLNLFLCHFILNYKSTSLIGFNYLNLFILALVIINQKQIK